MSSRCPSLSWRCAPDRDMRIQALNLIRKIRKGEYYRGYASQCKCLHAALSLIEGLLTDPNNNFELWTKAGLELLLTNLVQAVDLLQSFKRRIRMKDLALRIALQGESYQVFKQVLTELQESMTILLLGSTAKHRFEQEMESLSSSLHSASWRGSWEDMSIRYKFEKEMENLRTDLSSAALQDKQMLLRFLQNRSSRTSQFPMLTVAQAVLQYESMTRNEDGLVAGLRLDHKLMRITRHLGVGSYGAVYEIRLSGYLFAAKTLFKGTSSHLVAVELNAVSWKHPNIVSPIGYAVNASGIYTIIMERMEMDLGDLITLRKQPFSTGEAISIMLQIAQAMEYLHLKNVIHRDLNRNNILVVVSDSQRIIAKVADFGTAKSHFYTEQVKDLSVRGTRGYMAPEVKTQDYSRKSDVFSFTMVCYEVLSGHKPFEGMEGVTDLIERGVRPNIPESWFREFKELLNRGWSEDTDNRPSFTEICKILNTVRRRVYICE